MLPSFAHPLLPEIKMTHSIIPLIPFVSPSEVLVVKLKATDSQFYPQLFESSCSQTDRQTDNRWSNMSRQPQSGVEA